MTVPTPTAQELYSSMHIGQSIWKRDYGFNYAVITRIERHPDGITIFYKRHNDTTSVQKFKERRLTTKIVDGILLVGDSDWIPYIVMSMMEESCITCISKCKKNEMCTFYQSVMGDRE